MCKLVPIQTFTVYNYFQCVSSAGVENNLSGMPQRYKSVIRSPRYLMCNIHMHHVVGANTIHVVGLNRTELPSCRVIDCALNSHQTHSLGKKSISFFN